MEHLRKHREQGNSSQLTAYEDFHLTSDWTHDSNCHVLLVDLPGFKKEEVKVQVDNNWKVTVSGERKLNESKGFRFKEVFDVPKDSDIDKIGGRFDGGLLFVIIPKKATVKMEETKRPEIQSIPSKGTEKIEETKKAAKNLPKKATDKMEEIIKPAENQLRDIIGKEEKKEENLKDNEQKKDVHSRHEHGRHGKHEHGHGRHEHGHDHLHGEMKEEAEIISGRVKGLVAEKYDQLHDEVKKEEKKINEGLKGLVPVKGKKGEREDWRKKFERMKDKERVEGLVENAKEMISKNKTVIVTAVLAISVGLYITHRLRSSGR